MATRKTRRLARWAGALSLAFAAAVDAASLKDTIAGINAGTIAAEYKLTQFEKFAANSPVVTAALTGGANSVTLFAFTDEAFDNIFNNTDYAYKTYFGYDAAQAEVQGSIAANHLIQSVININNTENLETFTIYTHQTALKGGDAGKLLTTDTQVVTTYPPIEAIYLNSGLTYIGVIETKSTDQGPLHIVDTVMLPYPTADQAMKYSSEIAGPGNFYNFTLFQDALTKNGISTDGYQKVTVLAIEDSRFQDFMTTYASKFTADQIKQILQYHIIPDQTLYMASTFATLSTPIKFKTLSGEEIQFSRTNDTNDFYVGHPGVSEEDYPGYGYLTFFASDGNDKGVKNGVLQALNEVLIPPALVSNLPPPTEAPVPTEDPNATGTFTMPTESFTMTEDPSLTATAEAEPSSSDAADGAPAQATTTSAPKSTLIKPSGAAGKVGGMMAAAAAVLGALLMLA